MQQDLALLACWCQLGHHRVNLGVIADHHPQAQLALKRGVEVADHETDLEERRRCVEPLELVKQPGGVGAGAVVEGERDLASLGAAGGDERLPGEQPVDREVLAREQPVRAAPGAGAPPGRRCPVGRVGARAEGLAAATAGDHDDQNEEDSDSQQSRRAAAADLCSAPGPRSGARRGAR